MKMPNNHKPTSNRETTICIADSEEYASVMSDQLPVARLLREICSGDTGTIISDDGETVTCLIDKRHISLNDKAYTPR